ncbi:MAG: EAL domain-containing protein [Pseudomonadota bacterium]
MESSDVIPTQIVKQITGKCTEGLVLALASNEDGAVMELRWCNRAFTRITGYTLEEVKGQRGTLLIGPAMEQGDHLQIIEQLMNWEDFSIKVVSNSKSGQPVWQKMSWAHLTDSESGERWWLCSIIELDPPQGLGGPAAPAPGLLESATNAQLLDKVERLERQNIRLYELAKSVTKDANEDALTGLSNRRYFEVELKSWVKELRGKGREFAVLYIDLDRFKLVNDTLGHDAGDRLLMTVAQMLRDLTEPSDLVARLGGDEFVVLRPLGDSALSISALADAIVHQMQAPVTFEGKSTSCSASIGVAIATNAMADPERIVADADAALYHAKAQGKGRWSFFTEKMQQTSIKTKALASDLLFACDRQEFVPYFQPLIDANSGRIASAEVLVRWQHPERGLLAPSAFLDIAANIGILKRIDKIVFDSLAENLAMFDRAGVELPRVAVNVSSGRLAETSFIHDIKASGIDPGRLTVEVLESVYLERMGDAIRWTLDELDELGVMIAVDDFGTGHASVQGLLKIRPDILKIDRQFIQPLVADESSRALVISIIGIGKSLGMKIVAEGVETEAHAQFVTEMGCDYLQGFFFGKPMPAESLCERIQQSEGVFWGRPLIDDCAE